jgi:hypothetical protein
MVKQLSAIGHVSLPHTIERRRSDEVLPGILDCQHRDQPFNTGHGCTVAPRRNKGARFLFA